ncbi:hypothetical protein [Actinoplanes sp. NPDC049265]|uniref:hypothetical protein n=1 Tax=Actinoplanes sp. NPDC049265 TaxID=3363902 RepID=UPI00371AB478
MSDLVYQPTAEQLRRWSGQRVGGTLRLTGPCPACGRDVTAAVSATLDGLETLDAGAPAPAGRTVSIACTAGCGRRWNARAEVEASGRARLAPSPDARLDEAAEAWRVAGTEQEGRLRAAAEKWIAGVTALLGVLTVGGVGLAAEPMRKLALGGRFAVAAVVAVAVVAAGRAIVLAYRAAYGWPRRTSAPDDAALLEWHARRREQPSVIARRLRGAATAAGVALGALVVAATLTWFLPAARPPAPLVRATMRDDATVCGTLLAATADGSLRVRRADDGEVATLPGAEVRRLSPVERC